MNTRPAQTIVNIGENAPTVFLYIPFTLSDIGELAAYMQLIDEAHQWRETIVNSAKAHKTPTIVAHELHQSIAAQSSHLINSFEASKVPPGSVIYVLGHGTKCADEIASHDGPIGCDMSIYKVAERLIRDGLTPELASNLKSLKLFLCGEDGCNQELAANLSKFLGIHYQQLKIDYYDALVSDPKPANTREFATKKHGRKRLTFLTDSDKLEIELRGPASNFKHTLRVGDVLAHSKQPLPKKPTAQTCSCLSALSVFSAWVTKRLSPSHHDENYTLPITNKLKLD